MVNEYKVLVITPHYLTFTKGLIEATAKRISRLDVLVYHNRMTEISRLLPARGNILLRARRNTLKRLIDNKGTPRNVGIHVVDGFFGALDRKSTGYGDKIFSLMKRKIEEEAIEFNLIHAHFLWPCGYAASKISHEFNVPLVLTAHGYDIYTLPFINNEWRKRTENILNSASYVTTVSQNNLACIKRLDVRIKAQVIPNGFDDALFRPMDRVECRKRLNLPESKKIILSVGNLSQVKGHGCLIESLEEIMAKRKDLLCIIVGSGDLKSNLQRIIKKKGLEEDIILVGGKSHNEIPVWMNSCDVFVLPSLAEGNPTVLSEALGCGVPFVGTRVGGVTDIITSDEYGSLCSVNDSHDLAEKILAALDKEWRREKIIEYSKNYTWDMIVARMLPIYEACRRSAQ